MCPPDEKPPTARVFCGACRAYHNLDHTQYMEQMRRADQPWRCPKCGRFAEFDQEFWEERHYPKSDPEQQDNQDLPE